MNGAGKSSVLGEAIRAAGQGYYDPDEATRRFMTEGMPQQEANARAWREGEMALVRAIRERGNFAFETTLGGHTMAAHLAGALDAGLAVHVFHVGLESVELHLRRVRSRVAAGGHGIPNERIRARYDSSRENLIRLLPDLTSLRVLDNSLEADPKTGGVPLSREVLAMREGRIVRMLGRSEVPGWAKPICAAAMKAQR